MTPERWKRIRSAIEAALEAPSAERREAALIEACADDPTQGLLELARAAQALGRGAESRALLARAREAGSLERLEPLSALASPKEGP